MSKQWTTTEIARMESRRFIWHDSKLLLRPLVPVWLTIALLSAIAGLGWRIVPNIDPPELYQLLDLCGLGLWLTGWIVARGFALATTRVLLYQLNQLERWARNGCLALALLGASVALAMAPSVLLLGYRLTEVLQQLSTQDVPQLNVSIGGMAIMSLALGGAGCVLAGSLLALITLRLSPKLAAITWLVITGYVHLSTLGRLADHISRLTPGGELVYSWVPPTLGVSARVLMSQLANPAMRYEYLQPLAGAASATVAGIVVVLVAGSFLAASVRQRDNIRQPTSVAVFGGIIAALAHAGSQLWVYLNASDTPAPGLVTSTVLIGPLTCVVLLWLFRDGRKELAPVVRLVWLMTILLLSAALMVPQLGAGQWSHGEVLVQAMLMFPLLLAAAVVISPISRYAPIASSVALCGFVVLTVPLFGSSVLEHATSWTLAGDHIYIAVGANLLVVATYLRALVHPSKVRLIRAAGALGPGV
jgi:hypothetical protein